MAFASLQSVRRFLVRVALAGLVSIGCLLALTWVVRTTSALDKVVWFIIPISVGIGFVPMWRWYPRDAYPIGLVFCPAVFFLLWYLGARCSP